MNANLPFDGVAWWQVAGWTMVHFLWLGTLVGVVAMVARLVSRRAPAEVRYGVALASFLVLAALPLGIGAWMAAKPQADVGVIDVAGEADALAPVDEAIVELKGRDVVQSVETSTTAPGSAGGLAAIDGAVQNAGQENVGQVNSRQTSASSVEPSRGLTVDGASFEAWVPYLPWLWLMGTPVTFALLATGVIGAERLRHGSREIHDGPIAEACARLTQALGVTRRVTVAACERIAAPVLVGIVRPIILLPPAALTGWSPDEIEMVLLHELAHVRRWDNLVNLVQRLVESLLFFHPAVWLMSGWVRREREACCDAVVVGRTNRPHAYAEMLVALAAQMPRSVLFHPAASSAMAAGPLRARIRRILQLEDDPMLVSGKSFAIVLSGLVVAATLAVLYLPTVGQAEESATAAEESATEVTEGTESSEDAAEIDEAVVELNDAAAELDVAAEELDEPVDELSADQLGLETPDGEVVIDAEADRVRLGKGANQPTSDRERVIATFPNPETTTNYKEFFQAVDEARAKGLYVDYVPRGETAGLIVVPKPTEADWPAMLGDPPRKERVIADRAWERLGLKLVPASRLEWLEFQLRKVGGTVKIVGGNVPKGLPLPAFLRRIGDTKLDSFDDLLRWLNSEKARSLSSYQEGVKVYAFADGHDYLFDAAPAAATKPYESSSLADGALKESADNWLAGVAFPSPKEGEIARRAWKELGIKVAPASEAELASARRNGMRGGLKLVDFEGRLNLEGPFILTHLQARRFSTGIADFDALASALDALKSQPADGIVVLNGIAGKGSVFQYSMRLPQDSAAAKSAGSTRFPSLEQQKLADAIYKAMDLEVEPIGDEELKRVKALGYDGGVLITEAVGQSHGRFQQNDILVGLHVWATTDLQEVVDVLSRDDLGELNPLKYYVVRPGAVADPKSPGNAIMKDYVASGRIAAQPIQRRGGRRGGSTSQLQPTISWPTPGENSATWPSPTPADGITADNPYSAPSTSQPAQSAPTRSTQTADPWSAAPASAAAADAAQPVRPTEGGATAANPFAATPVESAAGDRYGSTPDRPPVTTSDKSRLRYDGQTFDDWRSTWRNELSTEKRMEAVKALAAFGSAGYGKEAAETILEVVKQYDWMIMGGPSPVTKLKNQAILALAGGEDVKKVPMDDWLPLLTAEVRSGDKQMTMFAYWVFRQVEYTDEDVVPRLIDLSRDDQLKDAQLGLLERLSQVHQQANDPRIAQRMVEALGEGPDVGSLAMHALYPPSEGEMGMMYGRGMGGGGFGGRRAVKLELEYRPELIDALETAEGPLADHVADQVVSALTRLGPKAKPAVPRLLDLLMEADVAIARKLLWTIPAVSGSDQELRDYLNAVVEKAESPAKVKRAEAMLKTLDKRRQQEAGGMEGEMGMERGMMRGEFGEGGAMGREMGGEGGFRGGEGGRGSGYGGEGGRGEAESTPGDDAAIEESTTDDLFGPADASGGEGESGEAEADDLFGPSE